MKTIRPNPSAPSGHAILLLLLVIVGVVGFLSYRSHRQAEQVRRQQNETIARLDPVLANNLETLRVELEAADKRLRELRELRGNLDTPAGKVAMDREITRAENDRAAIATRLENARGAVEEIYVRQQAARAGDHGQARVDESIALGDKVASEAHLLRDSMVPSGQLPPPPPGPLAASNRVVPATPLTPAAPSAGDGAAAFARHFLELLARADAEVIAALCAKEVRDDDGTPVPAGHPAWRHASKLKNYPTRHNRPGQIRVRPADSNGSLAVELEYTAERVHRNGAPSNRPATLRLTLKPEPSATHGYRVLAWTTNE